ncbi:MAG: tRNA uridine-5-carboxymethylaminomethyl(34) synthesis GTPase MnmE [Elusimicrobia bacterium]|nr:tRNA uridine-5-carboxymethylaminomethyl(34) synthesis GTPase MnmE [Elusimicrobiota bacterium]
MTYSLGDTIAALSTPPGTGAIAVIRMTGADSISILSEIFHPSRPDLKISEDPNRLIQGEIYESGELIDSVMAVIMKSPRSYTGEDMVEIHSHGSMNIVSKILSLTFERGARPAEPGEFTHRAFMNGKMDLSSAEGLHHLINSRTDQARQASLRLMKGALHQPLENLKKEILKIRADIDAVLEWGETDQIPEENINSQLAKLEKLSKDISSLLERSELAGKLNIGLNVIISGRVNAGKSALFNALLDSPRSIVSSAPGTTRDIVDAELQIDGISIKISDSAGFDLPEPGEADRIAMDFLKLGIEKADLIIYVIDAYSGIIDKDLEFIKSRESDRLLVVFNKIDLKNPPCPTSLPEGIKSIALSALTGEGVNLLLKELSGRLQRSNPDAIMVTLRQEKLLKEIGIALDEAGQRIGESSPELASADLARAWGYIGEIDGSLASDDIYDLIFSEFCIGK